MTMGILGTAQGSAPALVLVDSIDRWTDEAAFALDLHGLSTGERQRVSRRRQADDRRRSLLGRLLLAEGLERLGYRGADALHMLQYTTTGKPTLADGPHFNISHSGALVVCAFSSAGPIGIDIERVGGGRHWELDDFADMMDESQWRDIRRARDPRQRFFEYWTMKESLVKAHGSGLSLAFDAIRGVYSADQSRLELEERSWWLVSLSLAPGYICHVASPAPWRHQPDIIFLPAARRLATRSWERAARA